MQVLSNVLASNEEKLLACIHCGLCLEACPTYVLTGNENDGPRGRLYLMRAVAEGRLENSSPAFRTHIDRCLGCRACEQVCPAGVEYGQLLESSRAELSQAQPESDLSHRLLRIVLRHLWMSPARLRLFFAGARLFRDFGLTTLLRKSGVARMFSPRAEFALALLESSRPIFKTRKRRAAATPQPVEPKHSGKPNDAAEPVRPSGDGSACEARSEMALPPDVRRGFASPDS